jgi:aryl-alcohol dehydrogenase-like predicted oxidoreductase
MGGPGWDHAWGPQRDDDSVATIVHAVERGVNWIDTAPIYGHGHSETVVGRALAALSPAERPFLFTKCGMWWNDDAPLQPPARDTRRIRRELEASLRRLGVDRVDLYQIHWPPYDDRVEDFWPTMLQLRDEGKVRAVGVSNFDCAQLAAAQAIGHVDSLQPPLSLLRPAAVDAEIRWCAANDTGVIVYSPLESGLLSGAFDANRAAVLPADDWRSKEAEFTGAALRRNLALVDALRPVAARHEVGVAAVAVAWTLAQPGVSGAIVGARHPAQVDGWLPAADLTLSARDLAEINAAVALRATEPEATAWPPAPALIRDPT